MARPESPLYEQPLPPAKVVTICVEYSIFLILQLFASATYKLLLLSIAIEAILLENVALVAAPFATPDPPVPAYRLMMFVLSCTRLITLVHCSPI